MNENFQLAFPSRDAAQEESKLAASGLADRWHAVVDWTGGQQGFFAQSSMLTGVCELLFLFLLTREDSDHDIALLRSQDRAPFGSGGKDFPWSQSRNLHRRRDNLRQGQRLSDQSEEMTTRRDGS